MAEKERKTETRFDSKTLEVLLEAAKEEYDKELEKSERLENKSNTTMTVVIALIAIFLPVIPFRAIRLICIQHTGVVFWCTVPALFLMMAAFSILIVGIVYLHQVVSWADYQRVNYDSFTDITVQFSSSDDLIRGLLAHYNTIILNNDQINKQKEQKLYKGMKISLLALALLSVAVIVLLIVVS